MRIGLDIRATQLKTQFGQNVRGVGKYVHELVETLPVQAPEHEYVFIAFQHYPLSDCFQALPSNCRVVMLPTRLPSSEAWHQRLPGGWRLQEMGRYVPGAWRLPDTRRRREQSRALEQTVKNEKLDVLHFPYIVDVAIHAIGDFRCRVVKTLLDLIPLIMRKEILDQWHFNDQKIYMDQLASFRQADMVVAISESAREDGIKHLGLERSKTRVVMPIVSEQFAPISDAARTALCRERYELTGPYFLYCSGTGVNKNAARVVQAFARFAGQHAQATQLVFVGPRESDESGKLKAIAFDSGLSREQFIVTGHVPDDDLATLFAGALALLTPSLYEGFGLPAAQAMRAGTPVIASDRSSQPEVVGDAGLLVDPYNVEAIAGAMLQLAENRTLRAELSARGLARATLFNSHRQAREMLEVYAGETTTRKLQG